MNEQPSLFHFDFGRLLEQIIPSLLIGALVVFANFKGMESQISDIRKELERGLIGDQQRQLQLQAQSEKLAGITAQIAAFLGQQIAINAAIDARLTYIERSTRR